MRRNIAAFGGDPHRITAMGESAGADAIAHLLAAQGADPLCDRAILQSPPLGIRRRRRRMLAAASRAVRRLDEHSELAELLAVEGPVHRRSLRQGWVGMMPFGIEYGRAPMPAEDEVEDAWRRVAPQVPLLIGGMGSEFSLFTRQHPLVARGHLPAWADRHLIGPLERWGERRVFSSGIEELAGIWRAADGEVLRYRIPWAAPGNPYGSPHGMDVALEFGGREVWEGASVVRGSRWEDFERAGRTLRAAWGAFARGEDLGAGTPGVIEISADAPPSPPR